MSDMDMGGDCSSDGTCADDESGGDMNDAGDKGDAGTSLLDASLMAMQQFSIGKQRIHFLRSSLKLQTTSFFAT